jgi:hypothetical protein
MLVLETFSASMMSLLLKILLEIFHVFLANLVELG